MQLELELEKSKLEVRQAAAARTEAEGRLRGAEIAMSGLEKKGSEKDRIIGEQKGLLDEIDRERDSFQRELDGKAEKLLQLQGMSVDSCHFSSNSLSYSEQTNWLKLSNGFQLVKRNALLFRNKSMR